MMQINLVNISGYYCQVYYRVDEAGTANRVTHENDFHESYLEEDNDDPVMEFGALKDDPVQHLIPEK